MPTAVGSGAELRLKAGQFHAGFKHSGESFLALLTKGEM
jgi:hypothetical protein